MIIALMVEAVYISETSVYSYETVVLYPRRLSSPSPEMANELLQVYQRDQKNNTYVRTNEVGRTCGTHWRGEKSKRFWWESPKERYHMED
jgi:hypothetical protein